MSFFSQEALSVGKDFEQGGGFELIPGNTKALAMISNAEWRDANEHNGRHINLTWDIVEGEFKGRKVFHKVKLFDADKAKALRAQKMLIAIDANCKGVIAAAGVEPTLQGLQSLLHSPMYILINVYTPKDPNSKPVNWIAAVSERKRGAQPQAQQQQAEPAAQSQEPSVSFDEDIPFAPIGLMYPSVAIHVI